MTGLIPALLAAAAIPYQDAPTVDDWVGRLGAPEYETREAAQKKLLDMGRQILPQLKAALERAEDPEIRSRLETILNQLEGPASKRLREIARRVEQLRKILADETAPAEERLDKAAPLARELRDAVDPQKPGRFPEPVGGIIQVRVCRAFRKNQDPEELKKRIEKILRERGLPAEKGE
jgi:hypothetical protein